MCGLGKDTQIDIHFQGGLLDIAARSSPLYFPELASLATQLNAVFRRRAAVCLQKKRKEWEDKSLELTLALSGGGLYLVYSVPKGRRTSKKTR